MEFVFAIIFVFEIIRIGVDTCVLLSHVCVSIAILRMPLEAFPTSQGDLIRMARGDRTKTEFAKVLDVDRSCLSRYESEHLGAPTSVLNHCLRAIAAQQGSAVAKATPLDRALQLTRHAVRELEAASAVTRSRR
jgi:hypothetical protein